MTDRLPRLTTPDLVVLSLLSSEPMHGYQLNRELERRGVRGWAEISRPQVYYSLDKLERLKMIASAPDREPRREGPARQVFRSTRAGAKALARALAREDWAHGSPPPPFVTWLALTAHATPQTVARQIARRRRFLRKQVRRERTARVAARRDAGMRAPDFWMVDLRVRLIREELAWLADLENNVTAS